MRFVPKKKKLNILKKQNKVNQAKHDARVREFEQDVKKAGDLLRSGNLVAFSQHMQKGLK